MRLLEEKRLLHASKLEKEVAHEKAQRAKERVQRRQQMLEMWKGAKTSQKEPMDLSGASQIVEKRFFWRNDQKTSGACEGFKRKLPPSSLKMSVGTPVIKIQHLILSRSSGRKRNGGRTSGERILGPRHEAHGSALTPRQRHLEGQYRIRTVSNVLWQLESKAAALSFQKQQR
ncbi:hypothetical protein TcYC6_0029690 [Trypanosoma cruzi]|nr:hypothetical protein TcYC6_0029690 [Trypanosoma cruzi]